MKKKYGDIHTIWYGETPLAMIFDVQTIMEIFVRNAETYTGKSYNQIVAKIRTNGKNWLIFNDGPNWRHHRRDTLHIFRNFGMGNFLEFWANKYGKILGKSLMQEKVFDETQFIIQELKFKTKKRRFCWSL